MTLAAAGLDYGFRDRAVGRGVAIALRAGEVACLLGPNGSGKTTLIRTLLGLLPPLAGRVELDGRALGAWSARERATRLAYVPQAPESPFEFTVAEIVEMGRAPRRGAFAGPAEADRAHARAVIARLGLEPVAFRPASRVSGGERQLALIARALATGAAHLLMDEPTANLDFGNQARVLDEIAALRAGGAAVLFSTHHPEQALRIADRAILLKEGTVRAAGPTREVVTTAALTALYGRDVVVADVAGAPHPLIYRP
jgi:iron complex transport system ATP-binding protein